MSWPNSSFCILLYEQNLFLLCNIIFVYFVMNVEFSVEKKDSIMTSQSNDAIKVLSGSNHVRYIEITVNYLKKMSFRM